jgi:fluoride exporter
MIWLAVALGGAFGSAARHGVNVFFSQVLGRPGPYATATVNILGSLVIGLLAGLIAHGRLHETPAMRAFVFVGILGGFTTFSSFMLDSFTLAEGGHVASAFANVAGQVIIGYAAAYIGFRITA